jgi:hypothetical protein
VKFVHRVLEEDPIELFNPLDSGTKYRASSFAVSFAGIDFAAYHLSRLDT